MDLAVADVLERVRGKRSRPEHEWPLAREIEQARIGEDCSVGVAAYKVAQAGEVLDGRPAMGVRRNGVAGAHACVEDPDAVVLEQHSVVLCCGGDGVERIWPRVAHRSMSSGVVTNLISADSETSS
jgi:hypothetical protein